MAFLFDLYEKFINIWTVMKWIISQNQELYKERCEYLQATGQHIIVILAEVEYIFLTYVERTFKKQSMIQS